MTRTLDQANLEISRVRQMPYGLAHTQAAEEQVKLVESEGPDEAKAFALFTLIDAYQWGGEPERGYVPFAQLLRWWDQRPEMFDTDDQHSLFWAFKWMVSGLADFPNVPAEQIERTLDDMERRYALAGNGMDAVALERFSWSNRRGAPETEDLFARWVATPRDDFSQCEACDPGDRAAYLISAGRLEEGVRLIEETLPERPRCASEPADMLADLADAYLDLGRPQDAVRAHRQAVAELAGTQGDMASARGRRIRLLARGGQPERAIRALEAEQHLLVKADTPYDELSFARLVGAATHVLRAKHADRALRITAVSDLGDRPTVADLDDWLRAKAERLAAAFDARNGTDHQSDLVRQAWSTEAASVALDLEVLPRGFSAAPAPDGSPTVPTVPTVPTLPTVGAGADPAAGDPLAQRPDEDTGAWADRLLQAGEPQRAAAAWIAAAGAADTDGRLVDAGFAYAECARIAQLFDDQEGADAGYRSAVPRLRAGGLAPELLVQVLVAWAPTAAQLGTAEDALGEIDRCLAALRALDDAAATVDGSQAATTPEEKLAARDRATRRRAAADLEDAAARLLADAGADAPEQLSLAAGTAQSAAEAYGGLGAVADAAHAFWLAGRLYDQLGQVEDAVWNLESALEGFGHVRQREPWGEVASLLVRVLRDSGQTARAEELAREIVS
jgi:tetratricopeptide (TPR) repeat protein